jgi:hypothetical protein
MKVAIVRGSITTFRHTSKSRCVASRDYLFGQKVLQDFDSSFAQTASEKELLRIYRAQKAHFEPVD